MKVFGEMLKDDIQYTLPVDVTASVHQLNKDNYTVKNAFVLFPEAVKIDKKVLHLKICSILSFTTDD